MGPMNKVLHNLSYYKSITIVHREQILIKAYNKLSSQISNFLFNDLKSI